MSTKTIHSAGHDQDKQKQPLPGEASPDNAKIKVFLAAQKIKQKFKIRK